MSPHLSCTGSRHLMTVRSYNNFTFKKLLMIHPQNYDSCVPHSQWSHFWCLATNLHLWPIAVSFGHVTIIYDVFLLLSGRKCSLDILDLLNNHVVCLMNIWFANKHVVRLTTIVKMVLKLSQVMGWSTYHSHRFTIKIPGSIVVTKTICTHMDYIQRIIKLVSKVRIHACFLYLYPAYTLSSCMTWLDKWRWPVWGKGRKGIRWLEPYNLPLKKIKTIVHKHSI